MSSTYLIPPTNHLPEPIKVIECKDDIPDSLLECVRRSRNLACDIETTGLNWQRDLIGTCQVYTPGCHIVIVKIGATPPSKLISLLSDRSIRKVFHHAMFDLRFITHHWQVSPQNVVCTKIASKLLDERGDGEHSLRSLLERYLDVQIDKHQDVRTSNWLSNTLTDRQMKYAAGDVAYLFLLIQILHKRLESSDRLWLARNCYHHIPTQVILDVFGYKNIYNY